MHRPRLMKNEFDVVVIGAGMTGQTVAARCAAAGKSVLITDELPYGGTCALRGCDPKKMLVAAAEAVDWIRRMRGAGVVAESVAIDWKELQRFKRSFTDPVPSKTTTRLQNAGVETMHEQARFLEPGLLEIGNRKIRGHDIVIATGAEPLALPFDGAEHLVTSTEFLELESLPSDITFVGGGFISFELAHVAARAGSRVRIVEMEERPLTSFEPELVETLITASRTAGIEVITETRVTGLKRTDDGYELHSEGTDGASSSTSGLVVHGGGRVPRLDPLDLEAGNVKASPRGVQVDETLRSVSNRSVWAGGDAAEAGIPLTPVAVAHGHVIAANIARNEQREARHDVIPSVVFTIPALARVGLGEEEARRRGIELTISKKETSGWYSSRRIREDEAMHKVLVESRTGRIVGAHLLGHGSDEVINLFALAMRGNIQAQELKQILWSYPTKGSDLPFMV